MTVCETQRRTHAQSRHRRTMAAVMTLLAAIAAAALAPANNPVSNHPALACGSTPGVCPGLSGLPHSTGDRNLDL
jgi:hypothetical protein